MEVPYTVVFEPPSRQELRALLRMRRVWLAGLLVMLAIGSALAVTAFARTDALASGPVVSLTVSSHPDGARVWLDGRERGNAPLELAVTPGAHQLTLRAPEVLDSHFALQVGETGGHLDAHLIRREPISTRVRPSLPGATVTDARLLADGTLGLSIQIQRGQLDAWRLDPLTGQVAPLVTDLPATRLAVAADGQHVAYVGREIGPPVPTFTTSSSSAAVLWLVDTISGTAVASWHAPIGQDVLDASWSPAADGLLVATAPSGTSSVEPTSTHLWWVASSASEQRPLQTLPSSVVPGSEVWSPDGQHVAFMVHAASLNALCLVRLDGTFRYLADLDPSDRAPAPYAPVEWSADSQSLVFVAPQQQHAAPAPSLWFQATPMASVYVAQVAEPTPTVFAQSDLALPGWQADGSVIGLGRPRRGQNGSIPLQAVAPGNHTERLVELPLHAGRAYGAQWNADHTRALIADPIGPGTTSYSVVVLGAEDAP